MRTNLQISFQEKDAAKAVARRANTRIMWDAAKKVWYWEGEEKDLPECLVKYSESAKAAKADAELAIKTAKLQPLKSALELEKKGDLESLKSALEMIATCYYTPRYDGEEEIERYADINRIKAKIAALQPTEVEQQPEVESEVPNNHQIEIESEEVQPETELTLTEIETMIVNDENVVHTFALNYKDILKQELERLGTPAQEEWEEDENPVSKVSPQLLLDAIVASVSCWYVLPEEQGCILNRVCDVIYGLIRKNCYQDFLLSIAKKAEEVGEGNAVKYWNSLPHSVLYKFSSLKERG